MKTWLIALPLVCMVSVAMAGSVEMDQKGQPAGQTQPGSIRHKAHHKANHNANHKASHGMRKHKGRHFPKGDMRACLDLKGNKAIIRCSESPKKP